MNEVKGWVGMAETDVAKQLIGLTIRKRFVQFGWFNGNIDSFEDGKFSIVYEDGDGERMDLKTLAQYLPQHEASLVREYLGLPQAAAGRGAKGQSAAPDGDACPAGQDKKKQDKKKRAATSDSDSEVEVIETKKKEPECINISDSDSIRSSDEDEDGDSDDSEWEEGGSTTNGKAKIKVGKVTVEAFCVDCDPDAPEDQGAPSVKDESAAPESTQQSEGGIANDEVRNKIRKMLKLGLHPDTPDAEAQQALKQANRFLTRYNLQQVAPASRRAC